MNSGRFSLAGQVFAAAAVFFIALAAAGCSKDPSVIAVFGEGQNIHRVTVGDVKPFVLRYSDRLMFITNVDIQKNLIFSRFMVPDMVYQEQIKNGFTNSESFKNSYSNEYNKYELNLMSAKGHEAFKNSSKTDSKELFDVVHPSHILISTDRTTNIERITLDYITTNGIKKTVSNRIFVQTNLSASEFTNLLKAREAEASGIIDNLKKSGDVEKEFNKAASNLSADPAAARNIGDDGLITKNYMVKDFEDAVFAAKNKGLIDKPVSSPYGYYIIFIKEPPSQKSIPDIEKEAGKDNFQRIEPVLINMYYDRLKNENLKDKYTADATNKTVAVEGKNYKVSDIPGDAVMLDMWGKPLTWKECIDDYSILQPSINQKMSFDEFANVMRIIKSTFFDYGNAVRLGLEKNAETKNDMSKFRENVSKYLAVKSYFSDKTMELNGKIKETDTPEAEKAYYDKHKEEFMKNVRNGTLQMSFKEASGAIKEALKRDYLQKFYVTWKDEMMKNAKASFIDAGLRDLKSLEMEQFEKINKNFKVPVK